MSATSERQTPTVTISRSPGTLVRRLCNLDLACSWIGGVQIAIVCTGLLEVSLLGAAVSDRHYSGAYMGGLTFYAFLFMVAFWCFMTSSLLLVTSMTSVYTSSSLPKTTFFSSYHVTAAFFYVCTSASLLGQVANHNFLIKRDLTDIRNLVIAAGVFGLVMTALYIVMAILGINAYKRG